MTIPEKIAFYCEDFELFETPNEKLEYVFDFGKKHITLPEEAKNDATFIGGCASAAWLSAGCENGVLHLQGEGTSEIAKGMLALLLDIFNDRPAKEILAFDPAGLQELGIVDLLSPVRQQSMEAFLDKLYAYAKRCAA